jgi:MscS family membrane protein
MIMMGITENSIAFAILEGKYGWMTEILALLGIVVVFNFLVKSLLKRFHIKFDREKKVWQDSFVRAFYKPISCYVWFMAILLSIDLIGTRFEEVNVIDKVMRKHLLSYGAILTLAWFLFKWKSNVVVAMMHRSKKQKGSGYDQGRIDMVGKLATLVIIFVTIMLLMEASDRSLQTLIAFGGVSGLAIAFASQEIIANFFSGLVIYMTHPFAVGDWIVIPEKDLEGHVEEIGWYTTCVRTFEKRPIYVPNSIFSKLVVVTPSRMSHRQIKEIISIRYQDKDKLLTILSAIKEMLCQHPSIDPTQRMLVHFTSFRDQSLDILVDTYCTVVDTVLFADVKQDVLLKIGELIENHGAEISFPIVTVDMPHGLTVRVKDQ